MTSASIKAVFDLLRERNAPLNVQLMVDNLQTKKVKKSQVEKSLDSLVSEGKVTRKEFGKQKIFFLAQAKLDKATPEEVGALKTKAADLKNEVAKEKEDAGAIRKELARLKTQLTEEEIRERTRRCEKSVAEKRERLQKLEKASGSISKSKFSETRLQLQNNLVMWRKHRKSFYGIWNQIMESMETANEKKLMDDVCIETDEAAGVKFADLNELVAGSAAAKKRKLSPL